MCNLQIGDKDTAFYPIEQKFNTNSKQNAKKWHVLVRFFYFFFKNSTVLSCRKKQKMASYIEK